MENPQQMSVAKYLDRYSDEQIRIMISNTSAKIT